MVHTCILFSDFITSDSPHSCWILILLVARNDFGATERIPIAGRLADEYDAFYAPERPHLPIGKLHVPSVNSMGSSLR